MRKDIKNKKAFTLIELLAVIIILGVLLLVAVPSVTEYILHSRRSAFVNTAVSYISAVRNKVNQGEELKLYEEDVFYFVQVGPNKEKSLVSLEKGGSSPFNSSWDYAYVGVIYSGTGFSYYFMGKDGSGQGIELISEAELLREKNDYVGTTTTDFKEMYNLPGQITYTVPHTGIIFDKVTEATERSYPTVIVINKGDGEYLASSGELDDGSVFYYNPVTAERCTDYNVVNSKSGVKEGCLKWYIYGYNYATRQSYLLLDHNTSNRTAWSSSMYSNTGGDIVKGQLFLDTRSWAPEVRSTARLLGGEEIPRMMNLPGGNLVSVFFETGTSTCDNCSSLGKGNAKYSWLFDRTSNSCENYGCYNKEIETVTSQGFWTSSRSGSYNAFAIDHTGKLESVPVEQSMYGVRPVIAISGDLMGDNQIEENDGLIPDGTVVYFNPETAKACKDYWVQNSNTDNRKGCMKWYTFLDDGGSKIKLILDHNTTGLARWSTTTLNDTNADALRTRLEKDIVTWDEGIKSTARSITAQEIATITKNVDFNASLSGQSAFYLENNNISCPSCSTLGKGRGKYGWLYDRTTKFNSCEDYGCYNNNPTFVNTNGFWTESPVIGTTNYAWYVTYTGILQNSYKVTGSTDSGVRPVIEIDKSMMYLGNESEIPDIVMPTKVYEDGEIIYFNAVSGQPCDTYVENNSRSQNKYSCMKWYAFLDDGGDNVNLLLDHNTTSYDTWSTTDKNDTNGDKIMTSLQANASTWSYYPRTSARIISAQEIAQITKHPTFRETQANESWFFFENNNAICSECSSLGAGNAKYDWLFDRISSCEAYGCNTQMAGYRSYWTISKVVGTNSEAWSVTSRGRLEGIDVTASSSAGVRPVITIPRYLLQ